MRKGMRGNLPRLIMSTVVLGGCGAGIQEGPVERPIAITHVTVIDVTTGRPLEGQTVLLSGDRITTVGPAESVGVPPGARVVDGSGRYLIPGLADMHAHLSLGVPMARRPDETEAFLLRMLYYGVTSILALGGSDQSTDMINSLRARQAEGSLRAPRIFATGGHLTLPGSHPIATIFSPEVRDAAEILLLERRDEEPVDLYGLGIGISLVRTEEAARRAVRERAAGGMDAIKITVESGPAPLGDGRPRMPLSMIRAVVEEAAAHGLGVFAHATSPDELADVLDGGGAGVLHTVTDPPLPGEATARRMVRDGFYYVPTLTLYDNFARYLNDPSLLEDPFLRATVSWEEIASLDDPGFIERHRSTFAYVDGPLDATGVRRMEALIENVGFLHAAGVAIVVGTDTGNPFTFPGYSVHQELELLVRAGLAPAEALAAGTYRAAEMLGRGDDFGTIEAGKRADLVLLDADPLADILNTRQIHAVVVAGVLLDRGALDAMVLGEHASAPGYPRTRTVDVFDDYHGTRVADPFRWLEALADEETRVWASAQNALLERHLDGDPLRDRVRARMAEMLDRLESFPHALPIEHADGSEFLLRAHGQGAALYVRAAPDADFRMLVDPGTLSAGVGISEFWVAPDGRHVAYALAEGGGEWLELRVRNVDTGVDLAEVLEGLIYPSVAWTRDSRGFLYTHAQRPAPGERVIRRDPTVRYHRLGTPQERDRTVFSTPPGTTDLVLSVDVSEDGRHAFIYEGSGSYQDALGWALTRMYFLDLKDGDQPDLSGGITPLNERADAAYRVVGSDGPIAHILTSKDAPRHRVVSVDLRDPGAGPWRDLIPQGEGVLQSVHRVDGRWVAAYLENVQSVLRIFSRDGTAAGEIALPTLGSVFGIRVSPTAPEVTFSFSSLTHPDAVIRHDLEADATTGIHRLDNGFDGDDYEVRQLWYSSRDGTRVPMFVAHRRGISLDGSNPTILHGYGSSGTPQLPWFSEGPAVWLELGGVYVVANVRGGGEFGQAWYEAATLGRKQASFDDFIAAAEHLVEAGYTTPERLAIHGHSFGGLLVGAVMTQRPELFAAVVAENPVLDMLRRDPGQHAAQYGRVSDPDDFLHLYAYSPLHAGKQGTCYPPTLVSTAFNDDRVPAWHAFKFTAVLQAAQGCAHPVLLRTADSGGHAGSWGDPDLTAEMWAFVARHTGLADDFRAAPTPH